MNPDEVLYDAQGKAIGLEKELEETLIGSPRSVTAYYGNGQYAGEYRVPSFNTPSALNAAISETLGGCFGSLFVWFFLIWIFLVWNMHRAMWKYLKKGRLITAVLLFGVVWIQLDWVLSLIAFDTDTILLNTFTNALSNTGPFFSMPFFTYVAFSMRGLIWILFKVLIMSYLIIGKRIHI